MSRPSGLHSLAISVPERILTNEHWRENYPRLVAQAEERTWMWQQPETWSEGSEIFNREMAPYLRDPFRGARERRVLEEGGSSLELEAQAARQAMAAAGLGPENIDLLICTSFLPDQNGVGGATFLARELGFRGAAWNVESACSSSLIAFQTACSLISTGQYDKVLVVTSCTYSRVTVENDPIAWGVGDAATAMVVGPVKEGVGLLGGHNVHSGDTCSAVAYDLEVDEKGEPWYRLRPGKKAAQILRETSERYLRECTDQALAKAGVTLEEVDHFVFNTPLAWYASFCARSLGIDRAQTVSIYPLYANVGPALLGLNLFHAAHWRKFQPSDTVLLYSVGSASSCGAAIVKWGDVALGELPKNASMERAQRIEADTLAHYHLERLDAEVIAPARQATEADSRLQSLVSRYVELVIDEPEIMTLFAQEDSEGGDPHWSPEVRERSEHFIDTLESDIGKIFQVQNRAPKVDPTVAAMSLLGIVHWGVSSYRTEGKISRDEAIQQVSLLALHGLVTHPPGGSASAAVS